MKNVTEKMLKQNCFSLELEKNISDSTIMADGFFPMREWQKHAFEHFKDDSFMILNAPMGSGKSWMMCFLSAFKMRKDPSLRCIIAVPQTVIAPGFTSAKLQMPDGTKLNWSIV